MPTSVKPEPAVIVGSEEVPLETPIAPIIISLALEVDLETLGVDEVPVAEVYAPSKGEAVSAPLMAKATADAL